MDADFNNLQDRLREFLDERAAILCVGNVDRGDDGFGPAVASRLAEPAVTRSTARSGEKYGLGGVSVYDGGSAPENYLGRIALDGASNVLFVDAADFRGDPGEIRLLELGGLRQDDFSTHAASLSLSAEFLASSCGARSMLLAAQPKSVGLGERLSPEMERAVEAAVELIRRSCVSEADSDEH